MNKDLPCKACCKTNNSCCHNPQILWTMQEMDNLVTEHGMEILEGIHMFQGEIPGMIYLIRVNPNISEAKLDYCAFYDPDTMGCSVYGKRPIVCQTYGDPEYNECPYDGMTDDEIIELAEKDPETMMQKHADAKSFPEKYYQDFIDPWIKAWEQAKTTNPEYSEWWEKLPQANFIRKGISKVH